MTMENSGKPESLEEYQRLLLVLSDSSPGTLVFVECNSVATRRALPDRLRSLGLERPYAYFNIADLPPVERHIHPSAGLPAFLACERTQRPVELLYIDRYEARPDLEFVPQAGDAIESLNTSREALSRLEVIVVFLMPAFLIDMLQHHAMNLWSWRGYYFVLTQPQDKLGEPTKGLLAIDPDRFPWEQSLASHNITRHKIAGTMPADLIRIKEQTEDIGRRACAIGGFSLVLDLLKVGVPFPEDSREHLQHEPLRIRLLALKARALWGSGDYQTAINMLADSGVSAPVGIWMAAGQQDALRLSRQLGWYRHIEGDTEEAEQIFLAVSHIQEKKLAPDSFDLRRTQLGLASVYRTQGRVREAASLLTAILVQLGPEVHAVITTAEFETRRFQLELAQLYLDLGQYAKSEQELRQVMARQEKWRGDSLEMAAALQMMATVLLRLDPRQPRLNEAKELLTRALEVASVQLQPPDNPGLGPLRRQLAEVSKR